MADVNTLHALINEHCSAWIDQATVALGELTVTVKPNGLLHLCRALHDHPALDFKQLVDVCGIDYLHYGLSEWETQSATFSGFERGVDYKAMENPPESRARFAAIYHLLSLKLLLGC